MSSLPISSISAQSSTQEQPVDTYTKAIGEWPSPSPAGQSQMSHSPALSNGAITLWGMKLTPEELCEMFSKQR